MVLLLSYGFGMIVGIFIIFVVFSHCSMYILYTLDSNNNSGLDDVFKGGMFGANASRHLSFSFSGGHSLAFTAKEII